MTQIIFISHSTTSDNENKLASGFYDVELSSLGIEQAREVGERFKHETFDAIFCSDLQRSYKTAHLAFGDKFPIIMDARLRECNYGTLNRTDKKVVDAMRESCLKSPYPQGESFTDTTNRMRSFLQDIARDYQNKKILIVGHRATQYGLDHLIKGISLKDAVLAPWTWQPMWFYELKQAAA